MDNKYVNQLIMKTFIITQIAKQFRKKIANAKNVKVSHLSYMYQYNYMKLLKSYYKALVLWDNYSNQ